MRLWLQDLRHKQAVFRADGADASFLKILLADGSGANFLYRSMRFFANRGWTLPLALLFQYLNKLLNHCVIGIKADFGPGLVLMHPTGVVINSKVRGAENIVIESGVVIGDEKGQSPCLQSDVFVGAGAKIIGPVTVGRGAKIGANAVVVKSVDPDTTVVGIPARPLKRKPS